MPIQHDSDWAAVRIAVRDWRRDLQVGFVRIAHPRRQSPGQNGTYRDWMCGYHGFVTYYLSMEVISDLSKFNWIADGRHPIPPPYSSEGVPLSCLLPLNFECYAKILHRFDTPHDTIDQSLGAEELRILKIPDCTTIRNLVAQDRPSPLGSRILWKEAAQALGVPYAPELTHSWFARALAPNASCWPRFIEGPADGALKTEECQELASLLGEVTPRRACFFRLAELPYIGTDQSLLFKGMLNEVADFFASFQCTPEYWWPSDHQWCVCSEYDLTFTIVGGSSNLITLLLRSEVLECLEVRPEIRVDDFAPFPAGELEADGRPVS